MQLKSDHQLILVIVVFFLGFGLRGYIINEQIPLREIITGLVTLIAAYAGASYAFKLQNDKSKRDILNKQLEASNRAIYTLYDIWNVQKQYIKDIIIPYKGKSDAWLNLSPTVKGMHEPIVFNTTNLGFLLSSGKPEIYVNLLLEEKRYRILLSIIEERSKLVFEELNPKMESFGLSPGSVIDQDKLEKHLGPDLTNKLKKLTDAIIEHAEENIISIEKLHGELQSHLRSIIPNETFITVQFSLDSTSKASE